MTIPFNNVRMKSTVFPRDARDNHNVGHESAFVFWKSAIKKQRNRACARDCNSCGDDASINRYHNVRSKTGRRAGRHGTSRQNKKRDIRRDYGPVHASEPSRTLRITVDDSDGADNCVIEAGTIVNETRLLRTRELCRTRWRYALFSDFGRVVRSRAV